MAKKTEAQTHRQELPPLPEGYKTAGGEFPEVMVFTKAGQWVEGKVIQRHKLDAESTRFGRENVVYHIQITAASDGLARPGEIRSLFGTGLLNWRMSSVPDGANVQIAYLGKVKMRSGQFKGKEAHDYRVAFKAE